MNSLSTIRSKRLITARESRCLTQKELSEATGISQSRISKFESDERDLVIPDSELERIAQVLEYPISFFDKTIDNHNVHLDFRKGKTVSDKTLKKITSIVNRTRFEINSLIDKIEIEAVIIPENIFSDKPYDAAKQLRKLWKIPPGPIINLINEIEHQSILLMAMKFLDQDKFSACAIEVRKFQPLIIYNSNHPIDRIRFSIAHELGHIFLHHYGEEHDFSIPFEFKEKYREDQANAFASEFLMPEDEIKKDLIGLTVDKLLKLKFKWRVSMAALLERAKRLEIIDQKKYTNFRKEFSSRHWLMNEPGELPIEEPLILKDIIEIYQSDLGFTKNEISEAIGLLPKEFNSIYLGKVPLSIVQSKKSIP